MSPAKKKEWNLMKKSLAFLLAVMMVMSIAFAATAEGERKTAMSSGERYEKVTIAINSDPQDLLPCNVNGGSKPYIYQNFYECLFDLVNNEYQPVLAKGYTVVDDTHYRVELHDSIYDSAGNHITADDVVFCTEWLLTTGYAFKYNIFEKVEKIDDYTVEYTWTAPVTGVGELEFPWCRTIIFSQKAFEEGNFATNPVGTGPYVVTSFISGSGVTLEANPNYWQKDTAIISRNHMANVQTIQYDVITESSQNVIALQTGAAQYSEMVPSENLAQFDEGGEYADRFDVSVSAGSLLYIMTPNMSEGTPLNDINLRKAVFYAIDNEACATVTGSTVACKAFGTSHFSDYVEAWDTTPSYINTFDPELAKEYLAQSGYNGETLTILSGNDEVYTNLVTIIQAFLLNVGINAQINAIDSATAANYASVEGEWDLFVITLGGGSQIGEWNRALNYNELGIDKSYGFIHDEKLQELFTTAKTVGQHTDENMTILHDYILENAYQYALVTPRINAVCSTDFAELIYRENEFLLPGACDYYLD